MRILRPIRILAAAGLLWLLAAGDVVAQVIPGVPAEDLQRGRQEFTAATLRSVNEAVREWKRAWEFDAIRELADRYSEDAVVVLPGGERLEGRDAIRQTLSERVLPGSGEVLTRQMDLVASGRMAVSTGRYWFQMEEEGVIADQSGTYVMVFLRENRTWRIRSQLFSEDEQGM